MFKHITVKKKLSVFVVALFIVSLATGTYFSYDQGYAHGYIQGLAQAGGTPTVDGTVGVYNFPWLNATTGVNAPEFYLNSEDKTHLFEYPEQASSYTIFKSGSTYYAKNGTTGQIDYSGVVASTVIQAAIDSLSNGGAIKLRIGTYQITTALTLKDGVSIVGESWGYFNKVFWGTVLEKAANISVFYANTVNGFSIRHLAIDGKGDTYTGVGLSFTGCSVFRVEDIAIYETESHNVYFDNCGVFWLINSRIWYPVNGNCIYLDTGCSDFHIAGLDTGNCQDNSKDVMYIDGDGLVYNNKIYMGRYGINAQDSIKILDNEIDYMYYGGITISANRVMVIGNWISRVNRNQGSGGSYSGIGLGASRTYCKIENNMIRDPDGYMEYGVYEDTNCDYNSIQENTIVGFDVKGINAIGSNSIIRNNIGFITENSGTTTLVNGQTSITVSHGCDYTPSAGDLSVHPIEVLGSASYWYVDTITSTQFTIRVNADPGQDVDFAWSLDRH